MLAFSINNSMRKLLILVMFLQGCSSVGITHDEGSMPKVELESVFCDTLRAKVKSDELRLTCTLTIQGDLFSIKKD